MIHLSHSPKEGLIKTVKVGPEQNNVIFYSAKEAMSLPNGDCFFFEGSISQYAGIEKDFLYTYLKGVDSGIGNLILDSENWDGAWAMVYITKMGNVFCFTDPLGKKQLYYNEKGDICSFINPLIKENSRIDSLYCGSIQKWGYNTDDRTPWSDIKRIQPNYLYQFFSDGIYKIKSLTPVFDFSSVLKYPLGNPDYLRALVRRSIISNFTYKVQASDPVAVLVSGGIDSSIIAYELLKLKRETILFGDMDLRFYTINNAEDAPYVEILSKALGIDVKILSYDLEEEFKDIKTYLRNNETPVDLGSMIPNQVMFRLIPEKTIVTGDGPDEMFGGYNRIDEYDSQLSDVFQELSYYHIPRLEKAAYYWGKDLKCPWLSYGILNFALSLPYEDRQHKKPLKEAYAGILPDEILSRPKLPLKNDRIRKDPIPYRRELIEKFYKIMTYENLQNKKR